VTTDKVAQPRRIEYRFFVAGGEVTPEQFWAALKRLGGRAVVEAVDLSEPAYKPTARGRAEAGR
jgi:hypothetical protein